MIPTWPLAILAFLAAAAFFTVVGLPLARAVAPRGMPPLAMAPALGWAVTVSLALPLLGVTGFGAWPIAIGALAALACAPGVLARQAHAVVGLPRWSLALAAALAALPAMAIMPKAGGGGVLLAPPLFDHVKIALVDAILRTGLPVPNPFYGPGGVGHLAYYYLWHFGTAVLARGLHVGGWTAEAAMTGFTAFASLALVMGVTVALGAGARGAALVPMLLLPGSMRPVLDVLIGGAAAERLLPRGGDVAGWLNQAAWVPQHLASACCVILVGLLMLRLAQGGGVLAVAALGVSAAAAFQSSVWVGGIGLAAVGCCVCAMLVFEAPVGTRWALLARLAGAAMVAALLSWRFILDDLHAVRAHGAGAGVAFSPYAGLGAAFPVGLRGWLDAPAFWLVVLPFGLPAIVPLAAGALSARGPARGDNDQRRLAQLFWVVSFASLGVACLFRSTIDNNDLGWRAVLPAILLLGALSAACLVRLVDARRWVGIGVALGIACLGLPDAARMLREYAVGQLPGDGRAFARSDAFWQAVRRHSGPRDRVANNVLAVSLATPWPVNIGWATLGDRPSCFAGWESVIAYGALPTSRLIEINDRFARVFEGRARAGDVRALAREDDCAVAAISRDDGAWLADPFAGGPEYVLAEGSQDWRVYVRVKTQ